MGCADMPGVGFAGYRFAAVAVVDTGQVPPERCEPVEIGVTMVDGGVVGDTRTWLVRPASPITAWATRAHGLRDADVDAAPALEAVAGEIRDVLGDRTVVGHRGLHCHGLLSAALPGWSAPAVLDVRLLSARLWPHGSHAIGAMVARTGLSVPGEPGRAGHDAVATARLFLALARRLGRTPERLLAAATVLGGQPR